MVKNRDLQESSVLEILPAALEDLAADVSISEEVAAPINARQFNTIGVATKQVQLSSCSILLWWLVCIIEWQSGHRIFLSFMSELIRRTADLLNEADSTCRSLKTHITALQAQMSRVDEGVPEVAPETRGGPGPLGASSSTAAPVGLAVITSAAAADARIAATKTVLEDIAAVKKEAEKLQANLLKNKISSPDTIEADAQGFPNFQRILELLQKGQPKTLEDAKAAAKCGGGDISLVVEFGACLNEWKQSKRAPLLERKLAMRKELDRLMEISRDKKTEKTQAAEAPDEMTQLRSDLANLQKRLDEASNAIPARNFDSQWHPQLSGASFFGSDFIGDTLRELDRDLGVDGLYISLLETRHALLVILDTEGLLSVEARDDVFDKQVALMTMACSDLVIVNNRGELGRHVGDLFQVCLFALYHLKLARISPAIGFVLQCLSMVNQQQQYEWVATVKRSLEDSVQELQQNEKTHSFKLQDQKDKN
eukprot:Skav224512  [mRNA]  locus=scaffold825:42959:49132:- [translate_table: standard]